jgi:hypothetical protein
MTPAMKLRIFFGLMVILVSDASAYVDPGTGMLAIQGLLALIGGILIFVRSPIKSIKAWLERRRGQK